MAIRVDVVAALNEQAATAAANRLRSQMARAGTVSGAAFNAALQAEAARANIATDRLRAELESQFAGHGQSAGRRFGSGFGSQLARSMPGVSGFAATMSGYDTHAAAAGALAGRALGMAFTTAAGGILGAASYTLFKGFQRYEALDGATHRLQNLSRTMQASGQVGLDTAAIMKTVNDVVAGTPIAINEAMGAVTVALGSGIKQGPQLQRYLTDIADAAGYSGRSFEELALVFGQVQAKGRLMGEETLQLMEKNIPVAAWMKDTFKLTGDQFEEMQSKGQITLRALQLAVEQHAGGMAKAMGESIQGAIQNVQTAIARLGANFLGELFGKPTDDTNGLADALKALKDRLDDANNWVKEHGPGIRKAFSDVFSEIRKDINDLMHDLGLMAQMIAKVIGGIATVSDVLGGKEEAATHRQIQQDLNSWADRAMGKEEPGQPDPHKPILGTAWVPAPGMAPLYRSPSGEWVDENGNPWVDPTKPPTKPGGPADDDGPYFQDPKGKKDKKPTLPKAPVVPYDQTLPPGFADLPMSSSLYSAESSFLDSRHKLAEKRARLAQLEHDGVATEQDVLDARNDVIQAQRDQQQSEMRLYEAKAEIFSKQNKQMKSWLSELGVIGASLDQDFGISKGLAGIAENITKFIANLVAAPMLGKLAASQMLAGYKPGEAGQGLMGMLGMSGVFGPQYQGPGSIATQLAQQAAAGAAGSVVGGAGAAYGGDAALLAGVPAGRYDASGDLSRGLGDCSSAVEDLVNIMDGRPTAGRAMSTGNAAEWLTAHGFLPTSVPVPGAFQVGFNPSHMQATLPGGTPFNWGSDAAASGRGIGGSGAWDPSLTSHYYRPAGPGSVVAGPVAAPPAAPAPAPAAPAPAAGGGGKPVGPGSATQWRTNVDGSKTGLDASGHATGDYIPPPAPSAPAPRPVPSAPAPSTPPSTPPGLLFIPGLIPGVGSPSGNSGGSLQVSPAGFGPGAGPPLSPGGDPGTPHLPPGQPHLSGPGPGLPGLPNTANPTKIGGVAQPQGKGSGGVSAGGLPMAAASAAIGAMTGGIGGGAGAAGAQSMMQLVNRGIQFGSQLVGIGVQGLSETFLPAGSNLAANSWFTKIAGGLAGASPMLPNIAGKGEGDGGPTPEQVVGQGQGPYGRPAGLGDLQPGNVDNSDHSKTITNNNTFNAANMNENSMAKTVAEHSEAQYA